MNKGLGVWILCSFFELALIVALGWWRRRRGK